MNELNSRTLVYKTKKELCKELLLQADSLDTPFQELSEDEEYLALQNIEQIIYTLRHCDYEGKEN